MKQRIFSRFGVSAQHSFFFFFFYCWSTANWQQTVEVGLLLPAFQIKTSSTGWLTLAIGPFINTDMISPAFWLVRGSEFKITRSDDPSHTPLLQTTGNCLAGQTFRSKITSYGDFRNGTVWASNRCLGSCTAQYGGQYKSTDTKETSKAPTKSASGVTMVVGMDQWWWLVEEVAVHVLIMGLG